MGRILKIVFQKKIIILLFLVIIDFTFYSQVLSEAPAKIHYHPQYYLLEKQLNKYKEIHSKGGWEPIPPGADLKLGKTGKRVAKLVKRLAIIGELELAHLARADSFDTALEQAVKRFQKNHGIDTIGIAGRQTLHALNRSVEDRIRQIQQNIKKWQYAQVFKEDVFIRINIADFKLEFNKPDSIIIFMKIIPGRPERQTPELTSMVNSLVFNPYWFIPPNMTKKDLLPRLQFEPSYLNRNAISVFLGDVEVFSDTINWKNINIESNPYRLVRRPGPENPMGQIKFLFQNDYYINMHDTPEQHLFNFHLPAFSSGCIRLSKAHDLAYLIMAEQKNWHIMNIDSLIASENNSVLNLRNQIKIYIEYYTAWVDKNGSLQLREDIYNKFE